MDLGAPQPAKALPVTWKLRKLLLLDATVRWLAAVAASWIMSLAFGKGFFPPRTSLGDILYAPALLGKVAGMFDHPQAVALLAMLILLTVGWNILWKTGVSSTMRWDPHGFHEPRVGRLLGFGMLGFGKGLLVALLSLVVGFLPAAGFTALAARLAVRGIRIKLAGALGVVAILWTVVGVPATQRGYWGVFAGDVRFLKGWWRGVLSTLKHIPIAAFVGSIYLISRLLILEAGELVPRLAAYALIFLGLELVASGFRLWFFLSLSPPSPAQSHMKKSHK